MKRLLPRCLRHTPGVVKQRPAGAANPLEAYLLGVCALQGWGVLAGIARPTSMLYVLGPTLRIAWATLLLVGGIVAVGGLLWPGDRLTGVEIKRVGLFMCGGGTLAYGVALILLGPAGYTAATTSLGFSLACFVRIWQVSRSIRRVRQQLVAARAHGNGHGPQSPGPNRDD